MDDSPDRILTALNNEILDQLIEGFQVIGFDWKYLYVNKSVTTHGRKSKEDLLGKTMMEVYPGIEKTYMFSVLRKCMKERVSKNIENQFTYEDGSSGWFELRIAPISEGLFILSVDITERKHQEEKLVMYRDDLEQQVKYRTAKLKRANKEISILYKEMHHRIKNNLQIINSILNLQASKSENKELKSILHSSVKRIQTIAEVHENLYKKDRLEKISLKEFLSEMIDNQTSILSDELNLSVSFDCPDIEKSIDFIIPLGLLINELITNSLTHAFKNCKSPEISIHISIDQASINLLYTDNGCGFDRKEIYKEGKLGSILIECLSDQLDGKYDFDSSETGTSYRFKFRD